MGIGGYYVLWGNNIRTKITSQSVFPLSPQAMSHDNIRLKPHRRINHQFILRHSHERGEPSRLSRIH